MQHQLGFVYFHFSWLWDQILFFLFIAVLYWLAITKKSRECQQSDGSEVNTDENRDGLSWGSQANWAQ